MKMIDVLENIINNIYAIIGGIFVICFIMWGFYITYPNEPKLKIDYDVVEMCDSLIVHVIPYIQDGKERYYPCMENHFEFPLDEDIKKYKTNLVISQNEQVLIWDKYKKYKKAMKYIKSKANNNIVNNIKEF